MKRSLRLHWLLMTLALIVSSNANAQIQSAVTAMKVGKQATALVVTPAATGSAFCINESGIFATIAQVVGSFNQVKIVAYPGEKEQQILTTRVSHCDVDNDLAVLVADPPLHTQAPDMAPLTALPLSDSNALLENMSVAVFGLPIPEETALDETKIPGVTVTTGHLAALRKLQGQLKEIQLDAAGNAGGPVLSEQGDVIGILHEGADNAPGSNLAIPVANLSGLLKTPEIRFDPPPTHWMQRTDIGNWNIQIVPFTALKTRVVTAGSYDLEVAVGQGDLWRLLKIERLSGPEAAITQFHATGQLFLPGQIGLQPPDYKLTLSQNGKVVEVRQGTFPFTGAPAAGVARPRQPQPATEAPPAIHKPGGSAVQNPANGHWYQCVIRVNNISWDNARKAAEGMNSAGMRGHLASITSAEEGQFIVEKVIGKTPLKNDRAWIGGKQGEGARGPNTAWFWTTGEPMDYTNWSPGEPNNAADKGYLVMSSNGQWGDTKLTSKAISAYIVEFEITNGAPVATP